MRNCSSKVLAYPASRLKRDYQRDGVVKVSIFRLPQFKTTLIKRAPRESACHETDHADESLEY